jgi:3-hydroxyisobutyrate dehydrogenase
MAMSKPLVAFFGLGIMGSGMARRLLEAGFPLTVYNRSREKAEAIVGQGAKVATAPCDAAARAEILVSMVADDDASRSLWLGEQGALAAVSAGALLLECSTLSVDWVRELAAAATARGCELLDAPVTGSRNQAASGELNFLVGGSAAALERARPALSAMGRSITHVGPTGSGALLKLINNFLCGVQAVSLAEAIAVMEQSGLDRTKALDLIVNGTPGSPLFKILSGRMTARDYTPNFLLSLMAKDLAYALAEGAQHGLSLTTVTAALECFKGAVASGNGKKDFSVVVEEFRKR